MRVLPNIPPSWPLVALALLAQLFAFLRWMHRRVRDDEIHRAFVRDMAHNHLPHIYQALRLIAARLRVEFSEPPPVAFLDLDDRDSGERRRP